MLIRAVPESLSVISIASSAQKDVSIERLDALVRAEIDRKRILTTDEVGTESP